MKTIIIIALFAYILSVPGGWEKRSVRENSFEIERAFSAAFKEYSQRINSKADIDDLIRLTVYSQVVNGVNYKITFMDSQSEFYSVQEYIVYNPVTSQNGPDFEVTNHKEYESTKGLIPSNDPEFASLENTLNSFLKKADQTLDYISYVFPIESDETSFYIINADTSNGEHQYIIGKDKISEEFEYFELIN